MSRSRTSLAIQRRSRFNGATSSEPQYIAYDSFDRADSDTLGAADTGQAWRNIAGNAGVYSNKAVAKSESSGNSIVILDAQKSDMLIVSADCTFFTSDGSLSLILSCSDDTNNYMRVRVGATSIQFYRNRNSASTQVGSYAYSWANGLTNKVAISVNGNNYSAYLNGTLVLSIVDNNIPNNLTNVGLMFYKTGAVATSTVDNFKVEAL